MASKFTYEINLDTKGYVDGVKQGKDANADFATSIKKVKDDLPNMKREMNAARKEALGLGLAYSKLTKEQKQSGFGKALARELEEAKKHAADLIDICGDLNTEMKNMASDTAAWDAMKSGIGITKDALTAIIATTADLTGEDEALGNMLKTIAQVQSIANAAIQVGNALQKQSSVLLGIRKVQEAALAKAITLETSATKGATVAQRAFNIVANANPYVLLATAVLTVVSALAAFTIFSGKSAAEQEHQNKMTERAQKINESYYDGLNQSLNETVPKYIRLKTEWESLRTEGEKLQWIKDNQTEFESLGIQINDVNDAENVLSTNTAAVMKSFLKRAQAIGAAQQAAALYAQYLEDIQWLEEHRNDKSLKSDELAEHGFNTNHARIDHHGGVLGTGHARYALTDVDAMFEERQRDVTQKMESVYKELGRMETESEQELTNAGIKAIEKGNKSRNKARSKASKETKKVIHKNSLEEAEEEVKSWETALKQADINDTELINKIKEHLDKAKKEVERRKITLNIDVKVKNASEVLSDYEKSLADAASNAEAAMILAQLNQENDKVEDLTAAWEKANKQLENYNNLKKLLTEGIQVTASADLSKSLKGDFPATIKGYSDAISTLEQRLQEVDWSKMGEDGTKTFQDYIDLIKRYKEELSTLQGIYEESMLTPQEKLQKKLETTANTVDQIGKAVQAAGQLFSALGEASEDNDMKAMGIVAQAIATVALSFAQALTTAKTWVDWLAFGISGLATMTTMITQIKSLTAGSYANGGIVGGSSYYGDRLRVGVNSGEMILNRRQQKNLFDAIDQNKIGSVGAPTTVYVTGKIQGKDLLLVQKNANKIMSKSGQQINL